MSSMTSPKSSPSSSSSSSSEEDKDNKTGQSHFERVRQAWTSCPPCTTISNTLSTTSASHERDCWSSEELLSLHKCLLESRRSLKTPLPLSQVIRILIAGWRRDGLVPPSWPPPVPSSD